MKLLTLLLAFLFSAGISNPVAEGYKVGDKIEDFNLKNIDGDMVSLADYPEAKGYVVIFTCNHCPYAVLYEDRIIELDKKYSEMGYQVVAINPNDPEVQPADGYEEMQVRAEEKGFDFPYLLDEGQKVFPKFGATKTPHVFLVDNEMTVRYIGAIDDSTDGSDIQTKYVEDAIMALEKGTDIPVTNTKAIGCSIKVKK